MPPPASALAAPATPPPRTGLNEHELERMAQLCADRLRYAHFKVENGWAKQTLSEVENLYYKKQRAQPAPTSGDVFGPYAALESAPPRPTSNGSSPPRHQIRQQSVLSATSAPASNSVLGRSLYHASDAPLAPKRSQQDPGPGTDNMSLLAQASLMAPPASTPARTGTRTPPRRSAPLSLVTPTPVDRHSERVHAWTVPASSSTPPQATSRPTAPSVAGVAVPTNYAAFWAHVGSMGGLGSSTPAPPDARKRVGRPSLPPEEAEGPAKRVRVAGV